MKRRTFIKAGLIASGLGLAGFFVIPRFRDAVHKILEEDSKGLSMKPDLIERFIKEASREQFWSRFSNSKRVLFFVHAYAGFLKGVLPYRNKFELYRSQITGHFLLSTTFFINKMDVNKEIEYQEFYNPYKQPCYSPFATNFYPETA
jgi:hypothetical protein